MDFLSMQHSRDGFISQFEKFNQFSIPRSSVFIVVFLIS